MKRAVWIIAIFTVLELLLDVALAFVTRWYHSNPDSLWWVDFIVLPLLGLTIVLATRERLAVALVGGAAVGLIDGTVGLAIVSVLGSMVHKSPNERLALKIYGTFLHPVLLALLAAAGALLGLGIRFVLDKMRAHA